MFPHDIPYVVVWYIGQFLNFISPALTAIATIAIAWFTWTLKQSTDKSWRVANRSADIAERALLDLERGCIVPSFPQPMQPNWTAWHIKIDLHNVGRSYAIVKGVFAQIAPNVAALPSRPPTTGYPDGDTDTVIRPGQKFDGILPFRMPTKNEGQVLYGYIRYEDAFERAWRNYFAVAIWSTQARGRHFYQTVGGRAYNAEVLEKQRD